MNVAFDINGIIFVVRSYQNQCGTYYTVDTVNYTYAHAFALGIQAHTDRHTHTPRTWHANKIAYDHR